MSEDTIPPSASSGSETEEPRGPRISLWGAMGSGKTNYLGMLCRYLPRRGIRIHPVDPETAAFATDYDRNLRKGQLPPRNDPDPNQNQMRRYNFQISREVDERLGLLRRPRGREVSVLLSVMDAGGEWYSKPIDLQKQHEEWFRTHKLDSPIDLLRKSQGIICLIDSTVAMGWANKERVGEETTADSLDLDLNGTFQLLAREDLGFLIPQRVAFCWSKIDATTAWAERDRPRELAQTLIPDIFVPIINYCRKGEDSTKWFSISSIGPATNDAGEAIPGVDDDGKKLVVPAKRLQPYGLFEPLAWLIAGLTGEAGWLD